MLDHPLSVLGWLVAGIGFALLIFWVPTNVPSPGFGARVEPVFNMHKAQISQSVLLTGLAMGIAGAIAGGFKALRSSLQDAGGLVARSTGKGQPEESAVPIVDEAQVIEERAEPYDYTPGHPANFNRLKETHLIRRGMFGRIEIHEMDGGQFLLHDGQGWRSFASKEEAVAMLDGK